MIAGYLLKKKWHIFGFVLLTVFSTVMMSLFSLHIADVFNAAELGDYNRVLKLLLLMFAWYLFIRLMDYYADICGIRAVNAIRMDIKVDLFNALITKELPFFYNKNSGEYISEFTNDITMLESKYLLPLKELLSFIITIVTVSSVILTIDIRMTMVLVAGTICCLLLPVLASKYTSRKMLRFLERFDAFVQYLKDVFNAFFVFKNYSVEAEVADRFEKENADVEKKKYDAERALVFVNNATGRIAWLIPLLVIALGLSGVFKGTLKIGSVFSAYLLAGELGMPLQCIGNRIGMIRSMKSLEKKFEFLKDELNELPSDDIITQNTSPLNVEYHNVGLTIHNKAIIENATLTFEPGKKYLIIGKNGSGKSTLINLLKRTHLNYTGTITLDGTDLRSPDGAVLSRTIFYSNETVSLLSETVKNNITLFQDIPESRLISALKTTGLNVPLDRNIGDNGRFLSSGEKRKLEIARAIIRDPKLLIFDEVVSTLDIETAYEIEKMILNLDITVIMISNAFSGQLLSMYDEIILMDNGRVAAIGSHADLLNTSSDYKEIYEIRCGTT